jgi:hypothetical protein
VVTSAKEHTAELAAEALGNCWQGSGMKATVQASWPMPRPRQPYTLVLLKAVEDLSALRPMRLEFDAAGTGHLLLAPVTAEPVFLPPERWAAFDGGSIQQSAGAVTLHTPPGRNAYAFNYAPLTVPATGRYNFRLKGTPQTGKIAFGAFPADQSKWLASDIFGRRTPAGYEMSFSLALKEGDTVVLRIANNSDRDVASSFALDSVTVSLAR